MVANGIVVDNKTGKPVNVEPKGETTDKKDIEKAEKKDKK